MKSKTENLRRTLEHENVFYFFKRYGLGFVCSNAFVNAVYQKAREDVEVWFKHAPHGLNGDHYDNRKH